MDPEYDGPHIPGKTPLPQSEVEIPDRLLWKHETPPKRNTTARLVLVLVLATLALIAIVSSVLTGGSNPVTGPQ